MMKIGQSDLDSVEYLRSLHKHIVDEMQKEGQLNLLSNAPIGIMLGVLIMCLNSDLNNDFDNICGYLNGLVDEESRLNDIRNSVDSLRDAVRDLEHGIKTSKS